MTIKVGDRIPSIKLRRMTKDGPKEVTTDELFNGKKVVLFAVPGAFTPTCSNQHLPSYLKNFDKIKAQGIDTIGSTPAEFAAYIKSELAKWAVVVKKSGTKVD